MTEHAKGLWLAIGAYILWGVLPLYFKLLHGVPPVQILAHRVVWSLILLALVVLLLRRIAAIRAAARGRTLALLACSATLIAVNWLTYIWSVLRRRLRLHRRAPAWRTKPGIWRRWKP